MTIGERIKEVRKTLNLNQTLFGSRIGLKQAAIGLYENNQRTVSERSISDICREFDVSENWLRDGIGNMFNEPDSISLDEYARTRNLTDVEFEIIRAYMELPEDFRKMAVEKLAAIFERQKEKEGPPDYWAEAPKTPEELEKAYPPVEGPSKKEVG